MIKNVLSSLFAVFLFALGAAGSWYFVQWQDQQRETEEAPEQFSSDVNTNDQMSPVALGSDQGQIEPAVPAMPSPVRPDNLTAEEIFRQAAKYRAAVTQLEKRRTEVEKMEAELSLTKGDIDQTKKEIEGMLKQVQDYVKRGESIRAEIASELQELESKRQDLNQKMQEYDEARNVSPEIVSENLKSLARLFEQVDEEAAARLLKDYANDGDMENAIVLLKSSEERRAAKILSALGDDPIMKEIFDAYMNHKPASPPTRTATRAR